MIAAKLAALVLIFLPACSGGVLNFIPTIVTHLRQLPKCSTDRERSIMRSVFYGAHNVFRQKVAKGEQLADFEYNNSPHLMSGMTYDCDLEQRAIEVLNYGESYQMSGHSINYKEGPVKDAARYMYELADVVEEWTKEYLPRTRMMHPYAPYMGCAYRTYKGSDGKPWFKLACVYTSDRPRTDVPQTPACTRKEDCGYFGYDYDCLQNLCFAPTRTAIWN